MIRRSAPRHTARVPTVPAWLLVLPGLLALQAAADPARVAVLPPKPVDAVSAAAAPRFSALLLKGLAAHAPDVEVLGQGRTGKPGRREAAEAFASGMQQLEALQFDQAAATLGRGVAVALGDPANIDFPAVRQATVQLAVARFRMRQEKEARAALAELFRVDPSFTLPPGRYAPAFLEAVEKARALAARLPAGTLRVDGPEGWQASVDGKPLSRLPADFPGLRRGTHYLRAEGPGGEVRGAAVEVAGAKTQVRIDPADPVPPPEVLPAATQAFGERLDQYCQAVGADYALVTLLHAEGDGLGAGAVLYSAKVHGFEALPAMHFDAALARAPEEIASLSDRIAETVHHFGPLATLPLELSPQPGASPSNPRLSLREPWVPATAPLSVAASGAPQPAGPVLWAGVPWWVWVAGGAAAVGIAGGTAYGLSQASRRGTGTVTATW